MSKFTPEVGDVWEFSSENVKFLVYITNIKDYVHAHCITDEGETVFFREDIFDCKYLGKSKIKLEELFDAKKEENEKDNLATDLKQIVRDSAKQTREIIDN